MSGDPSLILLCLQVQVEFKMSEEKLTTALNELKEYAEDMIIVSKRLVRVTKKGVDLTDYRTAQDTYIKLDQLKSVVQAKLLDWEDLLPEDGEGDAVYRSGWFRIHTS